MRPLLLALLCAAAHAQPAVDVSTAGGVVVTEYDAASVPSTVAGIGAVAATIAPGLPRGLRGVATLAFGPGTGRFDHGRLAAIGLSVEAPLSGGRNGAYVALGGAWLDFDNYDPSGCHPDEGCLYESISIQPHVGLAVTGGLGARVPLGRFYVEPALSATVWDDVLVGARLGLGWRLR
ncbi:hypothetical protein [Rubrivirga marina]|uniref:Outer membrane protein beta-barrel domain-containing protein n=1 Tax=Rubrivirga marina TaxID=1196024 RepID=A0A271IX79_9BACT|nr:hypothetical protein [Rubrivirga marina]PAP75325.1 hypothetical protein BSZ37_02130 [Rubrivirga marina]